MRLIFIRHCDPDYTKDSLTEKGWKEAELLSRRVVKWDVTDFFVSPFGRAQDTANVSLKKMNRTAQTCAWLREFNYKIQDPETGLDRHCWDWLPEWFADPAQKQLSDKDCWQNTAVMQSGDIAAHYADICHGIDGILGQYNYKRQGGIYITDRKLGQCDFLDHSTDTYKTPLDTRTLVFVCHLGVMFAVMGHLLNISPVQLWQGFFVAPSSVTVLASEERVPGIASFRTQVVGDTRHLHEGGETVSASGYFTDVFEG